MLFTAGKLPKHNNVSWRGNSCLNDGKGDNSVASAGIKDLVGGYYDAGDAIKFNFPASFAMTMLSWSVIEYSAKYEAAGELNHVKEIIKWGTDYFLKCFNSTADQINTLVSQVNMLFVNMFQHLYIVLTLSAKFCFFFFFKMCQVFEVFLFYCYIIILVCVYLHDMITMLLPYHGHLGTVSLLPCLCARL